MGDSWGKTNLEYLFLKNNHLVINKSIFGGNNNDSLSEGRRFLVDSKHFLEIDIIIWFQTEFMRDVASYSSGNNIDLSKGYVNVLDQIHKFNHEKIIGIKELSPKSKWVIIGGHAPLYKSHDYSWADIVIEDYRSELLGIKLPFCHAMTPEIISEYSAKFGLDVLEDELTKYEIIIDSVHKRRDLFTDGTHPGVDCDEKLFNRIINYFK